MRRHYQVKKNIRYKEQPFNPQKKELAIFLKIKMIVLKRKDHHHLSLIKTRKKLSKRRKYYFLGLNRTANKKTWFINLCLLICSIFLIQSKREINKKELKIN